MRNKAATCSCGTRQDEWDEDREAYVGARHYCHGCSVLAAERDDLPKDGDRQIPGFHAFLMRRELYEDLHPDDD